MDVRTLTLVGGHPALDLVNTVERGLGPDPRDFLATPADLVAWVERIGLDGGGPVSEAALDRVRALREAAHAVLLDPAARPALDLLARAAAAAAARSRLVPVGDGVARQVGIDPEHAVEDRLADAAVALLTGPDLARVKRCPVQRGGCGWVFLDRTRNASRTWCRMADCGNQVKSRRLTERRRQQRADR